MNNRDELAVWLEILQKENQEMELLLEQERTPLRDKLEIEGAKKKEAMLKAYTAALQFKHNVKVKALEIEQNVLRFNNEDLNMKYRNLQRSHKKVEAEMAALRKANQELKQLKEPCVEEQGVEMAALRETNQELQQQKQRCVDKAVKIADLRDRNQELTKLKERCVKEEAKMAALQTTNQELKQQKLRCVEEKDAEIAALLKENQTLKQEKERCVEEKVDKKEDVEVKVEVEPEVRHDVKMNALEMEQKVLRLNNEDLNMKYGKLLKLHEKDKAVMAALEKANQEFEQQKERCVEEKDAEIVALHERNHELEQQKERCVEEKDAEIAALLKKQLKKPPQALCMVKEELVEVKVELEVEQEVRVDPPEQTNEPIPTTQRRTTPRWRRFINSFSCIRPNINDD